MCFQGSVESLGRGYHHVSAAIGHQAKNKADAGLGRCSQRSCLIGRPRFHLANLQVLRGPDDVSVTWVGQDLGAPVEQVVNSVRTSHRNIPFGKRNRAELPRGTLRGHRDSHIALQDLPAIAGGGCDRDQGQDVTRISKRSVCFQRSVESVGGIDDHITAAIGQQA